MTEQDPELGRIRAWDQELTQTGELRLPPRRNLVIRRLVVSSLLTIVTGGSVVSAALDRTSWRWWPAFCVFCLPFFAFFCWQNARTLATGRPVLVVDRTGITLGRDQLRWPEITAITLPKPTLPPGFQALRVTAADRRLEITEEHVKEPVAFGRWLERVWRQRGAPDL